jgi:hypothetical protein
MVSGSGPAAPHARQHKEKSDARHGRGDCPLGSTVRLKSVMGIEAAGLSSRETQSPSTLQWRLRSEVKHTCRFEMTVTLGTPLGLMDSRRYRGAHQPPDRYWEQPLQSRKAEVFQLRPSLQGERTGGTTYLPDLTIE